MKKVDLEDQVMTFILRNLSKYQPVYLAEQIQFWYAQLKKELWAHVLLGIDRKECQDDVLKCMGRYNQYKRRYNSFASCEVYRQNKA